jgi:hypothetical protein
LSKNSRALLGALLLAAACRGRQEPYVTYYDGDHQVSVRHPAAWRSDQAEQEGIWYRYFMPPAAGSRAAPAFSVSLLAGATGGTLEEYAARYLEGRQASSSRAEERQGVKGRSWEMASRDGTTRHRLLLLQEGGHVWGLYAQGEAAEVARHAGAIDEMTRSLTVERPATWPEYRFETFSASLRVPASWKETRRFSGSGTLLAQYTSPPLAVDQGGQTAHASLIVTFEPVPGGGGLAEYYDSTRRKLGENFAVIEHREWGDGYADLMRTETPVAISYVKRFYRARGGMGCSLVFEAREDIFPRLSRWADGIASTLQTSPASTSRP